MKNYEPYKRKISRANDMHFEIPNDKVIAEEDVAEWSVLTNWPKDFRGQSEGLRILLYIYPI